MVKSGVRWWSYPALAVVIVVLQSMRRADLLTNPQFWAEDGTIFFFGQLVHGTWASMIAPYAGYLLLIPRLVAALATLFPPHYAPLIYNLAALVIDALCCSLFVLPCFRHLLRSDAARAILCLFLAGGIFADELVGTLTGVQWFLIVAILLILALPEGTGNPALYFAAAFCLAAGLSSGLVMLLAPVAALRIWRTPGRTAWPAVALLLSAVVQLLVLLTIPNPDRVEPVTGVAQIATSTAIAFTYRAVIGALIGSYRAVRLADRDSLSLTLAVLACMGGWLAALWVTGSRERSGQLAVCAYVALAIIASAMSLRALAPRFMPGAEMSPRDERYFLPGAILFAYWIAVSLERWLPGVASPLRAALLALALGAGAIANYRIPPFPDYHWRETAPAVDRWVSDTRAHRPAQAVEFAIDPPPYVVVLPGTPGAAR